jgi:tetratricopeptide (TPR) repeat protein
MPQVLRPVLWLCVAMLLAVGLSAANAADRTMSLLPGNDLPGGDYSVLKQTTLKACEAACVGDNLCQAFTFNQKANWCFLKSRAGTPAPFAGATSGRIVSSETPAEIAKARLAELPFPPRGLVNEATAFAAGLPKSDPAPKDATYAELVGAGDAAAAGNPDGAMASYRQALGLNPNDPAVWLKLAAVAEARAQALAKQNDSNASNVASVAIASALEGFLHAQSVEERAMALGALADALTLRQMWHEAIATYRASLKLVDDQDLETLLASVVAQHGFRVTSTNVDADSVTPRVCAVFSDALPGGNVDLSGYVSVTDAPKIALDVEQSQICLTGVQHGLSYHIRLRAGLPAANGESLRQDVHLNV